MVSQSRLSVSPRIDYLSVFFAGSPQHVLDRLGWAEGVVQGHTAPDRGKVPVSFKVYPSPRGDVGTWVKKFEAWGQGADALAQALDLSDWRSVERVDWRVPVDPPPFTLRWLEERVEQETQGNINLARNTSRPRARRNGRDSGGTTLRVGSHASDARFTLYQRGSEPWALEMTWMGKHSMAGISRALREFHQQEHATIYDAICAIWQEGLELLWFDRTGIPYAVLTGEEGFVETLPVGTEEMDTAEVEQMLAQTILALEPSVLFQALLIVHKEGESAYAGALLDYTNWADRYRAGFPSLSNKLD